MNKKDLLTLISEELEKADKEEIKKIINSELDKKLKSKDLKDIVADEIKKTLKKQTTKEDIAEITKAVLKRLFKDLSVSHPYVIDRLKP